MFPLEGWGALTQNPEVVLWKGSWGLGDRAHLDIDLPPKLHRPLPEVPLLRVPFLGWRAGMRQQARHVMKDPYEVRSTFPLIYGRDMGGAR